MTKKLNKALEMMTINLIVSVAALYVIDIIFNIIKQKKLEDIFKVSSSFEAYFSTCIAGGINGILSIYLPKSIFPFVSVVVISVVYEEVCYYFKSPNISPELFIKLLIRDIFIVYLVYFIIIKLAAKNKLFNIFSINREILNFNDTFTIVLITSIIFNISLFSTRYMVNKIFDIPNDRTDLISTDISI